MIRKAAFPRSHEDLVRAIARMDISEFDVIEPVSSSDMKNVTDQIETFAQDGDNVTIILVRSS